MSAETDAREALEAYARDDDARGNAIYYVTRAKKLREVVAMLARLEAAERDRQVLLAALQSLTDAVDCIDWDISQYMNDEIEAARAAIDSAMEKPS